MNVFPALISFIFGVFYGARLKATNTVLLLCFAFFIAYMMGNYPYYPFNQLSTTYLAAVAGCALSSRRRK